MWASVLDFSSKTVSVIKAGLVGGAPETVLAAQPLGYGERWHRSGDRFFVQGDLSGGSKPIYSAPKGGAPVAFPVDPPSGLLLGVTKGFVYYQSSSFDAATSGVFRVPVAGGKAERVFEEFVPGAAHSWRDDDSLYINDANYLLRFSDSKGAKRITPVPTDSCTTHQVLAHGGYVYTVTYGSLSGQNQVWRFKE